MTHIRDVFSLTHVAWGYCILSEGLGVIRKIVMLNVFTRLNVREWVLICHVHCWLGLHVLWCVWFWLWCCNFFSLSWWSLSVLLMFLLPCLSLYASLYIQGVKLSASLCNSTGVKGMTSIITGEIGMDIPYVHWQQSYNQSQPHDSLSSFLIIIAVTTCQCSVSLWFEAGHSGTQCCNT